MKKIGNIFLDLFYFAKLREGEKEIKAKFAPLNYVKSNSQKTILVPLMGDFATMRLIFNTLKVLIANESYNIKFFYVHTPTDTPFYYEDYDYKRKYFYYLKSKIEIFKLCRIYSIPYFDVYASNFNHFELDDIAQLDISKDDILNKKYKGILIGDLTYDHYLRFYQRPTIDLKDKNLIRIAKYAEKLVDYWMLKLIDKKIDFVHLPYASYLHWGIVSRVALECNLKVYHFGSNLYFFQIFQKSHIYHSKNFKLYKHYWSALENKEKKLLHAESSLNQRLKGGISDMAYMKKSSFLRTSNHTISSNTSINVVIFLHCFFDSPHIYGGGLFVDFYEWLKYLLDFASKNTFTSYFIKPHPNGVDGNEAVVESFKSKYSEYRNIIFLDVEVSNLDIQDLSPNLIVTYYGTVAQEFSYLGFPVVLCGDSPMKYYNFTYQPETLKELDDLLLKVGEYNLPDGYDKEEILQFYYMHYMYYSHDVDSTIFQFSKNFTTGELSFTEYDNINSLIY